MRLIVEDVLFHCFAFLITYIRWIADDDVVAIGLWLLAIGKDIHLFKINVDSKAFRILTSHFQCFLRDIPCCYLCLWIHGCQRDSNTSAPCAYIKEMSPLSFRRGVGGEADPPYQFFCFWSGNQHAWLHIIPFSHELCLPQHVLYGFMTLQSLGDFIQFRLVVCG